MTLIDDDEIEEIPLILPEIRSRISHCIHRTTHKCLENREKNTSIFWDISLLSDITRIDPHQSIFWKRSKSIERLIGEDIAIGEEEDTRTTSTVTSDIPPRLVELPCDLETDKCLPCSCRKREKDTILFACDRIECLRDREFLIVSCSLRASDTLEWYRSKSLSPLII